MSVFTADQTRRLLPFSRLPGHIARICAAARDQAIQAPERATLKLGSDALFLAMPAADARLAIAKLICVHPANPALGLATIQGDVTVFDAASGRRLAILDGPAVTERRTAAVSLHAADRLRPGPVDSLLVVGAGPQARAHVQAFCETRAVGRLAIVARRAASAQAMLDSLEEPLPSEVRVIEAADAAALAAAAEEADVIVTATTATAPVLPERVRDDALLIAVGAFRPHMVEIPPALVRHSQWVVDNLEGARHEAGDLLQAGIAWDAVASLRDESLVWQRGRPLLFKSVGYAGWDLAAAHLAVDELGLLP
ncbi:ornithine cyclodeaminase/1-piperideine-2-carboxylate/1-pyrroline-2-carboxylate reductase [NAD(P)H] [Noviherbaspirillum humi]|uniref:Ornithine cyclodeaminase/1-piperideine-2-carboxylate/1-pyrroline-2-carboxylate reductase [NAD(P)H] n=1 Tax=Noviherbaspirillum humi TaxID=1688639 RepID=A0A239C058_9BURK|nr:delta(1)-pyrroline-2-carboxylate reductase family protein [Noviherbaspirillum humi]SNS13510.1 ornithine cyclodeaminase/1-piperideine-2-carboxylate/1-pyrroline-2-carboxylate reductase [NAD(P)H] [Noviherbaspirillum humi]